MLKHHNCHVFVWLDLLDHLDIFFHFNHLMDGQARKQREDEEPEAFALEILLFEGIFHDLDLYFFILLYFLRFV